MTPIPAAWAPSPPSYLYPHSPRQPLPTHAGVLLRHARPLGLPPEELVEAENVETVVLGQLGGPLHPQQVGSQLRAVEGTGLVLLQSVRYRLPAQPFPYPSDRQEGGVPAHPERRVDKAPGDSLLHVAGQGPRGRSIKTRIETIKYAGVRINEPESEKQIH